MLNPNQSDSPASEPNSRISWRTWIFWLLVIALVWFISRNLSQIQHLVQTLASGKWQWLIVAALVQVAYYLYYTWLFQSAFDTVEVKSSVPRLLPVVLSGLFVNVVTPSGGASAVAVFVDDAVQHGQSGGRTAAGTVLALIVDYFTFTLVLIVGLIFFYFKHDLQAYEVIGSIILLLIFIALVAILFLGLWNPGLLSNLLKFVQTWVARIFSWIRRPSPLTDDWYSVTTSEFASAGAAIHTHPLRLARSIVIALAMQLIDIASLYFIFLAFDLKIGFGVLVAGFAMGILFWIVSITPQGIGVVEGVMALTYTSLGVPSATAAAVSLTFRGFTFWLPLLIGFFMLRRTKSFDSPLKLPDNLGVKVISNLTALMGVINVISAVTPSLAARVRLLEQYSPSKCATAAIWLLPWPDLLC